MTAISSILNQIAVYVPEASSPVQSVALINAAREFCKEALALRKDLTPLDAAADTGVYALTLPADQAVADVVAVKYDGKPLTKKTKSQLDRTMQNWEDKSGTPEFYHREGAASIRLIKMPATAETAAIEVNAALQPTLDATTLDDELVNEHLDALVDGTLYRLYNMPGKPWSNPPAAASHYNLFQSAILTATSRAADGNMRGVRRRVSYGGY